MDIFSNFCGYKVVSFLHPTKIEKYKSTQITYSNIGGGGGRGDMSANVLSFLESLTDIGVH